MKTTSRTEQKHYAFNNAPRCNARTKHNNGLPCRCPAIRGKRRCRIHGGGKGSGGQKGNSNALKHGLTTLEVKTFRNKARQAIKNSLLLQQKLG